MTGNFFEKDLDNPVSIKLSMIASISSSSELLLAEVFRFFFFLDLEGSWEPSTEASSIGSKFLGTELGGRDEIELIEDPASKDKSLPTEEEAASSELLEMFDLLMFNANAMLVAICKSNDEGAFSLGEPLFPVLLILVLGNRCFFPDAMDEATNLLLCEGGLLGSGSKASPEPPDGDDAVCCDCDDSFFDVDGLFPISRYYDMYMGDGGTENAYKVFLCMFGIENRVQIGVLCGPSSLQKLFFTDLDY